MAGRFEGLSDAAWMTLEKLLPPKAEKRGKGMPPAPFRNVLNTVFYMLITGCRRVVERGHSWRQRKYRRTNPMGTVAGHMDGIPSRIRHSLLDCCISGMGS